MLQIFHPADYELAIYKILQHNKHIKVLRIIFILDVFQFRVTVIT